MKWYLQKDAKQALKEKLKMIGYLKSFYTKLATIMGCVMYISYALPTNQWSNLFLIGISVFVAAFLPFFTKISESLERRAVLITGSIFLGKVIRFVWQFAFNLFAVYMVVWGDIVKVENLVRVGGILGAVALTSFASQGLQYLMLALANRDIGNRYLNITLALSINVCLSAIASLGYVVVQTVFIVMGIALGFIGAFYSLVTDIKGLIAPKGGVGIFFGTFNPAHTTHMAILKKFIEKRKLEKVYVHSTVVPKLHQLFLNEGVIEISEMKDGMRIYGKTEKADFHINYFPTGNAFFEIENRVAMLKAAVEDAGLTNKVEVLYLPEIYASKGFYGIISYVRQLNPHKHIHALHGSDYGGLLVRTIYDETFLWPYTIVRKDKVSATAIRNGEKGMTSPTVTHILDVLKDSYPKKDGDIFDFNGRQYIYRNSRLSPTETVKETVNV
ncbi:MAG: hypothetical protein LBM93_01580 [Oscillospiraceae bacterium]|nr:hypothetical protein [Oscillospiraceae bacterium]